jgi:hypothetical protein
MMYLDDSLTSEELADSHAEIRAMQRESRFVMVTYRSVSGHAWHVRTPRTEVRPLVRDIHSVGGAIIAITADGN